MKDATGNDTWFGDGRQQDAAGLIVADLQSLMRRIQISIGFNELAAISASVEDENLAGVLLILDDVTPRYATANAALNACQLTLGNALGCLLEGTRPKPSNAPCPGQGSMWRPCWSCYNDY
jgi:hypothetical protein